MASLWSLGAQAEKTPTAPTKPSAAHHARKMPASPRADLDQLARELNAPNRKVESFCKGRRCAKKSPLQRFYKDLDALAQDRRHRVRVLHLGDSHIAADYITETIRSELQAEFGAAGRGFVMIDQPDAYGGRRLERTGWTRTRVVEDDSVGEPFGFSGMAVRSDSKEGTLLFRIAPEDEIVSVFYQAYANSPDVLLYADDQLIGRLPTERPKPRSRIARFRIKTKPDQAQPQRLRIQAEGPGARLFGLSFESEKAGLLYDAVGPVGVDAAAYLSMERQSLMRQVRDLSPDLIVIMLGGNDALAVRQKRRSLLEVRRQHEALIDRLKAASPLSDCLLWSPMDAGEEVDGKIVSKSYLEKVRNIQRQVAKRKGCAFWDAWQAMGGAGSFGRWYAQDLMNKDMIHPRHKGGELLGHLFARALLKSYVQHR